MARSADTAKRSSIMETAFKVFGELGFRTTTMKRIAEQAGISPGSIYTYFADKDELFKSTVEEGWIRFLARFRKIVGSSAPFADRLENLIDLGFQSLKEGLPLLQGMLFEASQRKLLETNLDTLCGYFAELLIDGQKQGAFEISGDPARRRKLIKITVVGVLFSVALIPAERTDEEIRSLKKAVKGILAERIRSGRNA